MTVILNGEVQTADAATLADLVRCLGLEDAKIATALNGSFVPARARANAALGEGDRIEIVAPMQGG